MTCKKRKGTISDEIPGSWEFIAVVTRRKLKNKGIESPDTSKMTGIKIDSKTVIFK